MQAQKPLTLKECVDYSMTNNSNIKIANFNIDISQKKVAEQIGSFLPQINFSGTIDNNLKLSTQLLPAEMMGGESGTYIPVKFGNKYSVNGGIQFTQKIYDPQSLLLIKTAKLNKNIALTTMQQTQELSAYNVCLVFFQTVIIKMQMNVLKSTLNSSEELLKSISLKYNNGMAKKIDVDKIQVSYNNTKSQLDQSELNYYQSLNSLKLNMGMPVDSTLSLADTNIVVSYNLFAVDSAFKYQIDDVIDYQLQKSNTSLMQLKKKAQLYANQPSLSFYGNYNYNAMRQEFNFFDKSKDWFPSSGVGIKLTIPIFSGLQRNSKLAQSDLNVKIANESLDQTEQSIKVIIYNYFIQYKNALNNIVDEKANLELAESVFKNSQLEYNQGSCSTIDLIQSENSYLVAQSNYYNKLLNLFIARIEYEKAKGSLMSFLNNLK
ncbi:MAG: hypothetical protein A2W91_19760 [Bacteroidetes bacterium GWF2_38_335]|nr:MAG: hypothetical protein A2W91_19760 [Bacteroidetes bacterium GWF2_38_335]OFY79273.1 MAG: hypothetical protein A2281_15895 [Bacteroidetes bacterium RIFOXYA12_FULL_38_20]